MVVVSRLSIEKRVPRNRLSVLSILRLARAALFVSLAPIVLQYWRWYATHNYHDDSFGMTIFSTMFFLCTGIGAAEFYFGIEIRRFPERNTLNLEPSITLIFSLYTETTVVFFLSSVPTIGFIFPMVHLSLYVTSLLVELVIHFANYLTRRQESRKDTVELGIK